MANYFEVTHLASRFQLAQPSVRGLLCLLAASFLSFSADSSVAQTPDPIAVLQQAAASKGTATWAHWGPKADRYSSWTTHSNRLVPVYTFGGNLKSVAGENSVYRSESGLAKLYGQVPASTLNPSAEYFDQTDVFHLQQQAVEAGKKRIVLFVFDGMDWQTTRAAAIAKSGAVTYDSGRGQGLAFQDYGTGENSKVETDFGFFSTSPHNNGTNVDADAQVVVNPGGKTPGGYHATLGGRTPWDSAANAEYLIGKHETVQHAYTDSAASATSMTAGVKTYNDAINVDFSGREVIPIARTLQEQGFAVGAVTSVPISHATPACAYANNVGRDDYQDLTRDMLGLPSVFHPGGLSGLDVAIGAGWGEMKDKDGGQGKNFVSGNRYLAAEDLAAVNVENGGKYVVAQRTAGVVGAVGLSQAAAQAVASKQRLFGFYGVEKGHLPFQTADGGYDPVDSAAGSKPAPAEVYSKADVQENPNLADMTMAAIEVLDSRSDRWWLMVEAGDVDWANHANNIDDSIGALLSGENAFQRTTQWIEANGGWAETLVIVTADHGHYLVIDQPKMLTGAVPAN